MPNFNYKSVWQSPNELGKSLSGFLPNITGEAGEQLSYQSTNDTNGTGAILETRAYAAQSFWSGVDNASAYTLNFNASRISAVYQDGQTQVVPASNCVLFCIRY